MQHSSEGHKYCILLENKGLLALNEGQGKEICNTVQSSLTHDCNPEVGGELLLVGMAGDLTIELGEVVVVGGHHRSPRCTPPAPTPASVMESVIANYHCILVDKM